MVVFSFAMYELYNMSDNITNPYRLETVSRPKGTRSSLHYRSAGEYTGKPLYPKAKAGTLWVGFYGLFL